MFDSPDCPMPGTGPNVPMISNYHRIFSISSHILLCEFIPECPFRVLGHIRWVRGLLGSTAALVS